MKGLHLSLLYCSAILLYLTGSTSCRQPVQSETDPTPQLPQPLKQPYPQSDGAPIASIFGNYTASWYEESSNRTTYPINNQTVSLSISPVAGDTVQVAIQASKNGKFSPGQNLTYAKAFVVSKIFSDGRVTYYVYLTQPTTSSCGYDELYIYSGTTIDYFFVPPGNRPCVGSRIRLLKQ
jgi:hypothetical protein